MFNNKLLQELILENGLPKNDPVAVVDQVTGHHGE